MYSMRIVGSDQFMEMPQTAQNLYWHLGMYADDDGFVNPNKVVRMIGSSGDDMKVLIGKGFVIPFESGVIVITNWKENNYIQKDRYLPTIYKKELEMLSYSNNVYILDTQVRLELGKSKVSNTSRADARDDEEDDSRLETDEDLVPNPGLKLSPKEKSQTEPLIRWAQNELKRKFTTLGKQRSHVARMLRTGYTPDQIKKQWTLLSEDSYWAEKGFDFATVANEISKAKGTPKLSHGTGHISEGISLPELRKKMEKEDAEFIRKAGK